MIDWGLATQHMAALEIQDGVVLALFPPKDRGGKDGCLHITIDAGSAWDPKSVEAQLDKRPGYSLGLSQTLAAPRTPKSNTAGLCSLRTTARPAKRRSLSGSGWPATAKPAGVDGRQERSPLLAAGSALYSQRFPQRPKATPSLCAKSFAGQRHRHGTLQSVANPPASWRDPPQKRRPLGDRQRRRAKVQLRSALESDRRR